MFRNYIKPEVHGLNNYYTFAKQKNIFSYEKLNPQGCSRDSCNRIRLSALRIHHEAYPFSGRTYHQKLTDCQ
jgi:hypothetical protein